MPLQHKVLRLECENCGHENTLYGVEEGRKKLSKMVSFGSLNRYAKLGLIPTVKVERGNYFYLADLLNFIPPLGRWKDKHNDESTSS